MNEDKFFSRETIIAKGKTRIKEISYSGYVDNNGNFVLTRMLGHIYAEKEYITGDDMLAA